MRYADDVTNHGIFRSNHLSSSHEVSSYVSGELDATSLTMSQSIAPLHAEPNIHSAVPPLA